jgi:hypothetical protein
MELRINVDGDDAALTDLYRWLARDSDLVTQNRITMVSAPPASGEQGGAFEAINVLVANATALGGLVVSVMSYRHARRKIMRGSVRLERDGVVVTIEPGSRVSTEEIIECLTEKTGPQGGVTTIDLG